jgi:hypothetical protein
VIRRGLRRLQPWAWVILAALAVLIALAAARCASAHRAVVTAHLAKAKFDG